MSRLELTAASGAFSGSGEAAEHGDALSVGHGERLAVVGEGLGIDGPQRGWPREVGRGPRNAGAW
jgi:hypothetical protein